MCCWLENSICSGSTVFLPPVRDLIPYGCGRALSQWLNSTLDLGKKSTNQYTHLSVLQQKAIMTLRRLNHVMLSIRHEHGQFQLLARWVKHIT
mmetsp:Transcript_28310/g.49459  ORF Transcript_28310/g.49459 Transcript_28310/m.49459 type:complete len:93 (+) Transcript_28310:277-555(+)